MREKRPLRTLLFGLVWCAGSLLLLTSTHLLGKGPETGFLNRTLTLNSETYRYQVYVPEQWSPEKKWPVVLFLHGAGERGQDGLVQTEVGIGSAIRQDRDRFPCIVVMPQCRRRLWWVHPQMQELALKALESALQEFNGEAARIYLTGLSMGGYGTWRLAANHPGKFAALVPICGGIRPPPRIRQRRGDSLGSLTTPGEDPFAFTAQKIGKTPVWVFHGGEDRTVPVEESRKMVEALKAAGANVTYTEYEGVGHNSWDDAYAEPDLMTWLLSHRNHK